MLNNNAGPQQGGHSIPGIELFLTLNSLFCERCMSFERRLDKGTSDWQWRTKKADGTQLDWATALFDFSGSQELALKLLLDTCKDHEAHGYALQFDPRFGMYNCQIVEIITSPIEGAEPEYHVKANANSMTLPLAICFALTIFLQFDVLAQHKALFPGSYIKS